MVEEQGTVVAVDGAQAWVETRRRASCDSCSVRHGCGVSTLAKAFGRRRSRVRVLNSISARVGDSVVLGLNEQAMVRGSLAVYAVPLLALLAGGIIGEMFARNLAADSTEPYAIMSSLLGLLAGFAWLRRFAGRVRNDESYQPVILRMAGK